MTEFYGMKDLSPNSFFELAERISKDEQVALKFMRTKSNGGWKKNGKLKSCNEKCRDNLYCSLTNSVNVDAKKCLGLNHFDL